MQVSYGPLLAEPNPADKNPNADVAKLHSKTRRLAQRRNSDVKPRPKADGPIGTVATKYHWGHISYYLNHSYDRI